MDTLSGFAPRVETYSIDEQFLDMTGMLRNFPLEDYGRKIQQRILQIAHVPVGVGLLKLKHWLNWQTMLLKHGPKQAV